jgi:rubrerythrin
MPNTRIEDFLDFAIANEAEAALLYEKTAALCRLPAQKQLLQKMANMEHGHEAALKKVRTGGETSLSGKTTPPDLQLADFMVSGTLSPESTIEDVLVFSIQAEQKAFDLYSRLAALEEEPATKTLLTKLANEEKQHKFDLESQLEKGFMKEN